MDHERQNQELEAVVNQGIAAALLLDLESGIKFMRTGGVPGPVILRVFLNPKSSRSTDWRR